MKFNMYYRRLIVEISLCCCMLSGSVVFGDDRRSLKRSPVVDAIEAIDKLGGTYSIRQPNEKARASIEDSGYDPRCFWEIGRISLGPATGQNFEPITDEHLASLHDHLLVLRTVTILDLDHTEVSNVGLLSLPPMLHLKHLRVDGTKVSSGLSAILARFPALETLEVANTDFTAAEWVAIVKKYPALKIKKREPTDRN